MRTKMPLHHTGPMRGRRAHGFTLIELMIATSIIVMLATLALPFWWRAKAAGARHHCINNLRIISIGKELYAINENKPNGASAEPSDLAPYLKRPFSDLLEPFNETYTVNDIGVDPTCSYGDPHVLP